jgi:hypothetical protein
VIAQLKGEEELPWEGSQLTQDIRRKLGIFRGPVLSLLKRDPEHRASMAYFCQACDDIFTSTVTTSAQAI